jgi:hypothetical protein
MVTARKQCCIILPMAIAAVRSIMRQFWRPAGTSSSSLSVWVMNSISYYTASINVKMQMVHVDGMSMACRGGVVDLRRSADGGDVFGDD